MIAESPSFGVPPIRNLSDFAFYKKKSDSAIQEAAIYRQKIALDDLGLSADDPQYETYFKDHLPDLYMVKSVKNSEVVAEYIGSFFARHFLGERAPLVYLVKDADGKVWSASKYIPNFYGQWAYRKAHEDFPEDCYSHGCVMGEGGKLQVLGKHVSISDRSKALYYLPDLAEALATAEFLHNQDFNGRNNGVVVTEHGIRAAMIDFDLSMEKLADPIDTIYWKIKDNKALIAAFARVIESYSDEFIADALNQLFVNVAESFGSNPEVYEEQRGQLARELVARKEIFHTEVTLLKIQEIVCSGASNRNALLDAKLGELDLLTLTAYPGRTLLNTAAMVAHEHPATFNRLDTYIRSYSQEAINEALQEPSQLIQRYWNGDTTQQQRIVETIVPYVHSKAGLQLLKPVLDALLATNKNPVLTHKILACLGQSPEFIYEALEDYLGWYSNKESAITTVFPYILPHTEYRDKILAKAAEQHFDLSVLAMQEVQVNTAVAIEERVAEYADWYGLPTCAAGNHTEMFAVCELTEPLI